MARWDILRNRIDGVDMCQGPAFCDCTGIGHMIPSAIAAGDAVPMLVSSCIGEAGDLRRFLATRLDRDVFVPSWWFGMFHRVSYER